MAGQNSLNPQQEAAAGSGAALRVVIAGPGSGKTRTMVEAVRRVAVGSRIGIMTFTNAAAAEFRSRLGDDALRSITHCSTLHSYCFKLIQRFGGFLGYIPGKVGILPDAERIPRLLQCRDKLGLKVSQKALLARLPSTWVATGATPGSIVEGTALVWREYEFLLKRNNLVDYDLILREGLALLQMPEVRCQVKLDYLFVDEYQDSASIDQRIYDEIPATNKMYVGDDSQSIFGFRGAHPHGFLHLALSGRAEVHKLELNYRSDTSIATAANKLIAHNCERVEKEIIPVSTEQGSVEVKSFEEVAQELAWLGTEIRHHTLTWPEDPSRPDNVGVAVLYRMNHDVKVCRDYLQAMGLPVQMPKFEQRPPDWERAMLLLALLMTPENQIIAERFFKLTYKSSDVDRWSVEAQSKGRCLLQEMKPPGFGSWNYPDGPLRILAENGVGESTVRLIQQRAELLAPDAGLDDLLHDLHSGEEPKASNEAEGIYCGTIHSFKGKEADVVFLPAFEQGILPHGVATAFSEMGREPASQQLKAMGDLEEERRLAFVGVTRARHELYISHCAHRRGPWGPVGLGQPSQFIREMGL